MTRWLERAAADRTRLVIGHPRHPEIVVARELHANVYVRKGYLADGVNWIDADTGLVEDRWVDRSVYVSAWVDDCVVGMGRLIEQSVHGLPAFDNFTLHDNLHDIEPSMCLEVSSLSIDPTRHIYSGILAQLFRGFFAVNVERSERYWVAVVERPLLRVMNSVYRLPFRPMGSPRSYLGGETLPVILDVAEFVAELDRTSLDFLLAGSDPTSVSDWLLKVGRADEHAMPSVAHGIDVVWRRDVDAPTGGGARF